MVLITIDNQCLTTISNNAHTIQNIVADKKVCTQKWR